MSTTVYGYRSAEDPNHQKHVKVWQVCHEAGVSLPIETQEYFGDSINLVSFDPIMRLVIEVPYRRITVRDGEGVEILVSEIPKGVRTIRFTNTW